MKRTKTIESYLSNLDEPYRSEALCFSRRNYSSYQEVGCLSDAIAEAFVWDHTGEGEKWNKLFLEQRIVEHYENRGTDLAERMCI